MANISDAYGKINFDDNFQKKNKKLINSWMDTVNEYIKNNDYYGIMKMEWRNKDEIWFSGTGRWAMRNSMTNIFDHLDKYTIKLIEKITQYESENIDVEVVSAGYLDYEPGSEFLVNVYGNYTFTKDANNQIVVDFITENTTNYDYTDRNRIIYEFEEGYLLEESKEDIKKAIHDKYPTASNEEFNKIFTGIMNDKTLDGYICEYRLNDINSLIEDYK